LIGSGISTNQAGGVVGRRIKKPVGFFAPDVGQLGRGGGPFTPAWQLKGDLLRTPQTPSNKKVGLRTLRSLGIYIPSFEAHN